MSEQDKRAAEAEKNADKAADEKKYAEAALYYTEAIKLRPFLTHLYMKRARAFLDMEQHALAIEDAALYVQKHPGRADGYTIKAEIEHAAQNYKKAVASYKNAAANATDTAAKEDIQAGMKRSLTALEEQLRTETRRPLFCLAVSLMLAVVILAVDANVLEKPLLRDYHLVRGVIVLVMSITGYMIGAGINWVMESDRDSLLEPPIDLLTLDGSNVTTSASPTTSKPTVSKLQGKTSENVRQRTKAT